MMHPKGHLLLVCFLLSRVCAASDLPAQSTTGPTVRIDSGVVEGTYASDNPKLVLSLANSNSIGSGASSAGLRTLG
jgi:hypothetical protein